MEDSLPIRNYKKELVMTGKHTQILTEKERIAKRDYFPNAICPQLIKKGEAFVIVNQLVIDSCGLYTRVRRVSPQYVAETISQLEEVV